MNGLVVLSLVPLAAALYTLRRVWVGRFPRWPAIMGAMVLIVAAAVVASQPLGVGRGVIWIAVAASPLAAILVLANRSRKARKPTRVSHYNDPNSEWPDWPIRWLIAAALAGLASIAMAALGAAIVPFAPGTRTMFGLIVVSVAWPLLGAWALGTGNKARVAISFVSIAIVSATLAAGVFLA